MSVEQQEEQVLEVFGALLDGYAKACLNLNIVAGREAMALTQGIEVMEWYPFQHVRDIEAIVIRSYDSVSPIMERVGMEMMFGWYFYGPGKDIVGDRGVDFLHYQSGSGGYASVVKGPRQEVGAFTLVDLNEDKGTALLHSTTPLNRDMERGVLIGGMSAPGDLDYIDVVNTKDPDYFQIEFH